MPGFETILPFLKPIEHLILDESISEVMVNGPDQVFVEKAGFRRAGSRRFARRAFTARCGQEHRPATGRRYLGSEAHPGFAIAGRQSRCRRHSSLQSCVA